MGDAGRCLQLPQGPASAAIIIGAIRAPISYIQAILSNSVGSRYGQISTNTTTETVDSLPFKLSDHQDVEKLKVIVKAQKDNPGLSTRDNGKLPYIAQHFSFCFFAPIIEHTSEVYIPGVIYITSLKQPKLPGQLRIYIEYHPLPRFLLSPKLPLGQREG